MQPQITPEIRAALLQHGSPLEVRDEQNDTTYVIVSKDDYRKLLVHEFQQWLQPALDDVNAGNEAEWNSEAILAEARRRFGSTE